jgi:PBP1b-binding outer membrane lipoprotein LpoB
MQRLLIVLALASILAGCAGTTPTCDGKDRRPINAPAKAEVKYPSCGLAA